MHYNFFFDTMAQRLYNRVSGEELKQKIQQDETPRTTISFYQYYQLKNPQIFRDHLYILLDEIGVLGRIYVSYEGINAQISVPTAHLEELRVSLDTITFLEGCRLNIAREDNGKSFFKLAIKVRDKIVADGLDDKTFDVTNKGVHLDAKSFNELLEREDSIVIDMRNHYESEVGHFEGAITPDVETFRESLPIIEEMLQSHKDKHIMMYCTGGIRCEKASAYFKHKGLKHVYQLNGGIIEYARQVEELGIENKFLGKNFVFDERLGERIGQEVIAKCHQCGEACDDHTNCANDQCHILFIQCKSCADSYNACCSRKCQDFIQLPEEERENLKGSVAFNGTKFGKGRYKALHKDERLEFK